MDGNFDQRAVARDAARCVAAADIGDQRLARHAVRAEHHQHGARSRHQLGDAVERPGLQSIKQRQGLLQIVQFNEQGIGIHGQKAHVFS
ncbi:hypothetical protein G6F57_018450 [Rhizopus arrhizus]|nr:hypothetical protein G6F57_018450 [Rhizopus arrhizus]